MRILCIDDDTDILNWMRQNLETKGHKVETADGSEEGIRRFKESKPDMVFVDLMMEEPDSGLSVIRSIRKICASTPVYLLSSVGDGLCSITDCADLKLDDVLQKPINLKNLLSLIESRQPKN